MVRRRTGARHTAPRHTAPGIGQGARFPKILPEEEYMTDDSKMLDWTRLMQQRYRVLLVGPPGIDRTDAMMNAAAVAKNLGYQVAIMRPSMKLLNELKVAKTLFVLDDLDETPIYVQAALMRLFDDRLFDDANVLVWAAANRPPAGFLCEPLRSRFHLEFDLLSTT
jgi:MoxR-like ATPase